MKRHIYKYTTIYEVEPMTYGEAKKRGIKNSPCNIEVKRERNDNTQGYHVIKFISNWRRRGTFIKSEEWMTKSAFQGKDLIPIDDLIEKLYGKEDK